jgi:high-affinity iron transporter
MRRRLWPLLAVAALGLVVPLRAAAAPDAGIVAAVPADYRQAVIVHDTALAARLRDQTALLASLPGPPAVRAPIRRLAAALSATRDALRLWPTAAAIARLSGSVQRALRAPPPRGGRPYDRIRTDLDRVVAAEDGGRHAGAVAAGLDAYALAQPLLARLGTGRAALEQAFWSRAPTQPGVLTALARSASSDTVTAAVGRARSALTVAQQSLGDVEIGRATVVTDAAILVFREGLEAVLILAAITASLGRGLSHLRHPVLLGGLAGIAATGLTWVVAQLVIRELGTGGLKLEAITGLLAIAVLLLVTNWFFHRVYWSQWIARFNRRRRSLERLDRLGFVSGQAAGLAILGLTSVYREGFETVLFLQNLEVGAGTATCLLGAGLGLAATLGVGVVAFVAQRKLPYKRMLIATGVLIALVLAVMTGTTVHVLQGLGWLPTTHVDIALPVWANSWAGVYATAEGLGAQVGALVVAFGSYFVARAVHARWPRRQVTEPARVGQTL